MLKKLLSFMLLAVMLFAFTACGDEPTTEGDNTTQTQSESTDNTATESKEPTESKEDVASKDEKSSKPTATSKPVSSKEKEEEKVTSIDTAGLSGWKKAYAEAINDNLKYYTKFALVNINNDSVPELYMKAKSSKAGDAICFYSTDNNATIFKISKSGGGSYVEKGGRVYNEFELNAGSNKTDIVIYKFDTTGFEKLCFGRFNNNQTNYLICTDIGLVANEKLHATTKQEFEDTVAGFIDLSKAKKLDANAVSISEIAKKLK